MFHLHLHVFRFCQTIEHIEDDGYFDVEINGVGNAVKIVVIKREDSTEAPVISDVLIKACFEEEGKNSVCEIYSDLVLNDR